MPVSVRTLSLFVEILTTQLISASLSCQVDFVALTAIVRGYLGRQKFKRTKVFRLANETGVLVAMKNTTQGE